MLYFFLNMASSNNIYIFIYHDILRNNQQTTLTM